MTGFFNLVQRIGFVKGNTIQIYLTRVTVNAGRVHKPITAQDFLVRIVIAEKGVGEDNFPNRSLIQAPSL